MAIITSDLLFQIRSETNLPPGTWYYIVATTVAILNRPEEIPFIYTYSIDNLPLDLKDQPLYNAQLAISRRIREALIKVSLIGGLPKSINALLALKKVTPKELQDKPLAFSPTCRAREVFETPSKQILERGQIFFDQLYGKVSERVMGQMDACGTEDLGLMARLIYGYVLSNTNVLNAAESSFVLIAGLVPQDVNPQLKGHLRGALNGGATIDEVRAVRTVVIGICKAAGMQEVAHNQQSWGWKQEIANL